MPFPKYQKCIVNARRAETATKTNHKKEYDDLKKIKNQFEKYFTTLDQQSQIIITTNKKK